MSSNPFHDHLDGCERCRNNPFNLCPTGARLLKKTAIHLSPSKLFIIRGKGVMRLQERPEGSTCRFETLGGHDYWAGVDDVLREADDAYLNNHLDQLCRAGFDEDAERLKLWMEDT